MKTKTKKKYQCKWCDYETDWAGAITNHIKGNHLTYWRGNLSETLGIPDTPGARQRREASKQRQRLIKIGSRILKGKVKLSRKELKQKRLSNFAQRKRFLEMGFTSSGKKRKRAIAPHILTKYSLNNGVHRHEDIPAPVVPDWNGEAARAILIASEIIKDVSVGMQLRSNQK